MSCPRCSSESVTKDGTTGLGGQRFRCSRCSRRFTRRSTSAFSGRAYADDIIVLAVRWYVRYRLSYAEVSEWLAERGILVDQSTIYRWVQRFLHVERTRNDTRRRPNSPPPPDPTPMSENPPQANVGEPDAELQQLASDPFGAPQPVVATHARNQVPYLGTEMRTSAPGAGLPTPEQPPALSMPAHGHFGCDEGQMLAPADAELANQNPQPLVPEAKPSTRSASSRTGEHRELMT